MSEVLAKITLDSKSRKIRNLSLYQKRFRFKCKRCATFCCRLGGPKLSRKDVERLKEAGCYEKDFLEPGNIDLKDALVMPGSLKNREDGSCIFLKFDAEQNRCECCVYDFRPILCRLYPFNFCKVGYNVVMLKCTPCCRGLNNPDGKLVDEKFITSHLAVPLLEAIELFQTLVPEKA